MGLKINKFFYWLFGLLTIHYFLLVIAPVYGVCPLCTVAVGTGVGLCRFLGIDDTVSGVWLGGLIISMGFWLADFLKKIKAQFPYLNFFSVSFSGFLVVAPLFWAKMIGVPGNNLWGVDKIVLGMIFGVIFFLLAIYTDRFLRKANKGKVIIYYQKVLIPILYLTILSFIFYKLTC